VLRDKGIVVFGKDAFHFTHVLPVHRLQRIVVAVPVDVADQGGYDSLDCFIIKVMISPVKNSFQVDSHLNTADISFGMMNAVTKMTATTPPFKLFFTLLFLLRPYIEE
jgi:hypothetical protein